MKLAFIFLFCTLVLGCASTQAPSTSEVEKGIKFSVVYEITPNELGELVDISVARVTDLKTKEIVQKRFSSQFLQQSKSILSNGKWKVTRDDNGLINKVYMFCFYSEAAPDSPVCDAQYTR